MSEDKKGRIEVVSPILEILNVLNEVSGEHPRLAKSSSVQLGKEFLSGASVVEVDDALKLVISKEQSKLKSLIKRYYERNSDATADEIELERYRKRIATRLCGYLKSLQPISDNIRDYDKLKQLFCLNPEPQ